MYYALCIWLRFQYTTIIIIIIYLFGFCIKIGHQKKKKKDIELLSTSATDVQLEVVQHVCYGV